MFVILWLLIGLIDVIVSEKILFVIAFGSRSHRFAMQPIAVKLADLGHDVSFLAAVKPEVMDPRITEINLVEPYKIILEQNVELGVNAVAERLKGRHYEHLQQSTIWWDVLLNAAEAFLRSKNFVEFVSTKRFDLVVGDFPGKELTSLIAYKMNAKMIWLNTGGALSNYDAEAMGLPIESYWMPSLELESPYWFVPDRLFYTFNALHWHASYNWYLLRKMDYLIEKHIGTDVPPLEVLLQNFDLLLLNERFPYTYPRALPPFAVPVGGMHVRYTDGVLPKVNLKRRNTASVTMCSFNSIRRSKILSIHSITFVS